MKDAIRESPFGQLVRLVTKNKYFQYPEEIEGFQIPWQTVKEEGTEKPVEPPANAAPASEGARSLTSDESLSRIKTAQEEAEEPEAPAAARLETPHLTRTKSRAETIPYTQERYDVERQDSLERSKSEVIVPVKTADGVILVDWYTTDDQANPQNWSSGKKVYAAFIIFIYTLVVYATSAIYTSAQEQVMQEFGLSYAEGSTILSLYVAGYGLGPLLFSPLSEVAQFGRNIPYIVSFALFVILSVPLALVKNYPGLLVLRFLTGFMGSPCLATGGASMQDLYSLIKLPYGMTAWAAAAFCAPAIGPLLSGFAVPVLGWRWAFWEVVIMSGPIWVLWFFTMPETSAANILLRRARRLRKMTGNPKYLAQSEITQAEKKLGQTVYEALAIPFIITIKDPAVLFVNIYSSFIYGTYYSFFEAFPLTYLGIYGFNIGELGIVYTGAIVPGTIVGIAIYVAYQWFYFEPDMRKRGMREQEHRLVPATIAVWFIPIGFYWFGWSADPSVHWIVSIIGISFFAAGAFVLFQCIFIYLPLTYPKYAASLFAMNDTFRSALAAGSIIYAHPLYANLGIAHGTTILASLMIIGCAGVIVLYFYGKQLRARSKFADRM